MKFPYLNYLLLLLNKTKERKNIVCFDCNRANKHDVRGNGDNGNGRWSLPTKQRKVYSRRDDRALVKVWNEATRNEGVLNAISQRGNARINMSLLTLIYHE